jgi:hypothetical protein
MAFAGLAVAPLFSRAQVKPTSTAPTEETIVLSPFVVSADEDTGFKAANSLAGGRLKTNLEDTPVAYSVITRDFIDALGINDLRTAATWSPNVVLQINGNTGTTSNDISTDPLFYTVRGAFTGTPQRNFFPANSPMLSYALDRYDFGRGPNAVLFGNGSLGGVSSSTTKIAKVGKNSTTVKEEVGPWEYNNTTIDVNRTFGDRYAVRAAATNLDRNGYRDREMESNRAFFLTGTAKLAEFTSLRLEGEYGTMARNIPASYLRDDFSGWDGKTTYSGRLDTLPANANAIGVNRKVRSGNNGTGSIIYNPDAGAIMNYENMPITLAGGSTAQTPIGGFVQGSLPNFGGFPMSVLYANNAPAGRFDNAIANSSFRVPSKNFSVAKDAPEIQQRWKDVQLTFDHRIGDFFLQVAGDYNKNNLLARTVGVRGGQDIYIDINTNRPDGSLNPQFLHPYTDGQLRKNLSAREMEGLRVAAGYFKDAGPWGKYTASMMAGYSKFDIRSKVYSLSIAQNADHRRWGAASQTINQTDLIRVRSYIFDDAARPYSAPATVRFVDPINGIDKMVTPIWALEGDRSDSVQNVLTKSKYGIAALNAKFWKDRIVLLGAVRKDDFSNAVEQTIAGGDYSATSWDGITPTYKPAPPADYTKLTYVLKNAAGNVLPGGPRDANTRPRAADGTRLAQYANDRFKDDYNAPITKANVQTASYGSVIHITKWLSVYGNYAETFNAPETIQRIDSTFLEPTVAKGTDFGIRSSLFDGRLNLNILKYKNSEINNSFDPNIENQVNPILQSQAIGNPGGAGRNIRNEPNIPQTVRDLQDRKASGYEFELVANLTRSWRTMLNVSMPKIITLNKYQDSKKYLASHFDILRQVVIDAGGINLDTALPTPGTTAIVGTAIVDNSIPINSQSPDVNTAVNQWNNLMNAVKNNFGDPVHNAVTEGQPMSVNVFTDYTFKKGPLKDFSAGIGMQYRGRWVIGNRGSDTIVNPANPLTAIDNPNVDGTTPVYAKPFRDVTATLGYVLHLKNKRNVNLRLRVTNLLNTQTPVYSGTVLRPLKGDYTSPARETVPGNNLVIRNPVAFYFSAEIKL